MAAASFPARAAIAHRQLSQLNALCAALLPANRFYSAKLARVAGPFPDLERFAATVPFTLKTELAADQQAHPPYGSNLTYPLARYTRCHQTSGTSGQPLRWLDTPDSWDWMLRAWETVLRASGVTAQDKIFFAFSFGPFLGFWLAFEAGLRLGCLCLPGGGMSSAGRVRAVLDHGATVLCCTPTYALHLAEVAAAERIDLAASRVRLILVAGEPGGSVTATRGRITALWPGSRVVDHHGMTEIGPVTFECPARPAVLHVMEENYIPEVIDSTTGAPVAPGTAGELVLTNLGRAGSPLLRYRTGDLVKASPEPVCACGRRDLALEGGILGRTDDMVVVRGVNVYPSAVEDIVRASGSVAEYQVRVSSRNALTELAVQIEPTPECRDADALRRRLERAFEEALSLRVPVSVAPPGTLPRFEMKAKRWVKD
jgi:phenylacetate-CoA ligase